MKKNFLTYKAYIFDMDGTLYYQFPLRLLMLLQLLLYYLFRPFKWKEAFVLREFRQLREQEQLTGQIGFQEKIIAILSNKYHISAEDIERIVALWIYQKPLKGIYLCRDRRLIQIIEKLHMEGKKIYIYSDYPVKDKKEILGVIADGCYYPDGEHIQCLKPDAKGLEYILKENKLERRDTLFLGDRYKKDGLCAGNADVDFLLLPSFFWKRMHIYKELY